MSETLITILSIAVIVGPIVAYVAGARSQRKRVEAGAGVIEGTMVAAIGRSWERQRARADRFVELARRMRLALHGGSGLTGDEKQRLAYLLGHHSEPPPDGRMGFASNESFATLLDEVDQALAEDDLENVYDMGPHPG